MRKNFLIAGAIALALLMTGCQGGQKKQVVEEQKAPIVKVDPARVQKVAQTIDFTASLEADKDYFIIPSISAATIEKIYVEVGDKVKKDQLLVDLDKMQYNTNKAQLVLAEATMKRMEPVLESGGISQSQYDEVAAQVAVLRENDVLLAKNLAFRSPVDGYVTAKYFEDGQLFSMSGMNKDQTVGILRIMDMDNLKAKVSIPEQYFPYVKKGMPVTIKTDLHGTKTFSGKVARIQPAINSATRSFEVEVTVPNKSLELRPGMFARTEFNMGEIEGVTVLDLAIQKQAGTNNRYVFVVKNGKVERRDIISGRQMGDRVEVVSGVESGEQIVTAGMSRLRDGMEVEIVK